MIWLLKLCQPVLFLVNLLNSQNNKQTPVRTFTAATDIGTQNISSRPNNLAKSKQLLFFSIFSKLNVCKKIFSSVWWAHEDSNLGPRDYESPALTN